MKMGMRKQMKGGEVPLELAHPGDGHRPLFESLPFSKIQEGGKKSWWVECEVKKMFAWKYLVKNKKEEIIRTKYSAKNIHPPKMAILLCGFELN
jgi:hypothetical protein